MSLNPLDGKLATVGNGTLTAALLIGVNITRTGPSGAFTDTFDSAANIIAALGIAGSAPVGSAFMVNYSNQSGQTATLAAGTGVTLTAETGAGTTVNTATVAVLLVTVTGAATVSIVVLNRRSTS